MVKKTLSKRVRECPPRGIAAEREYNAAANIRRVEMERPFEPVEMAPHIYIPVMHATIHDGRETPPIQVRGSSPALSEKMFLLYD